MTEIQGKSIWVQVSVRFKLSRVRVVGSRLYFKLQLVEQQLNNSYYVSYSSVLTHSTSSNSKLKNHFLRNILNIFLRKW